MSKLRGIPSMTGIRGVAALWVLLFHCGQNAGAYFGLPVLERTPFFTNGWHGVDLFFLLSGFILMYAHERDFAVLRWASIVRFARLRFTRIYPLNTVVLLGITVLVLLLPDYVSWVRSFVFGPLTYTRGAFISTLFLSTRWFLPDMGDFNQPVWSLSLEILGYAAFPILAYCLQRVVQKKVLIGLASLSLIASFLTLRHTSWQADIMQIAWVRMASCFLTGIVIYRCWVLTAATGKRWAAGITYLSVVGIFISASGIFNHGNAFHGDVQDNFLFAFLLYGLAFRTGLIDKFLTSRPIFFLGEISFPLYLLHVTPLLWLRYRMSVSGDKYSVLTKSVFLLCSVLGCILLASLLHYGVEKPFQAWGRKWAGARVDQKESAEMRSAV
jgi:peptidoglycan/LPS O-acetylase OafA/YrhL